MKTLPWVPELLLHFIDAFAPRSLVRATNRLVEPGGESAVSETAQKVAQRVRVVTAFATYGDVADVTLQRRGEGAWQRAINWREGGAELTSADHRKELPDLPSAVAPTLEDAVSQTFTELQSRDIKAEALNVVKVDDHILDEGRTALAEKRTLTGRVLYRGERERTVPGPAGTAEVYCLEIDVLGEVVQRWGQQLRELCVEHAVQRGDLITLSCYGQTSIGTGRSARKLNNYAIENHTRAQEEPNDEI